MIKLRHSLVVRLTVVIILVVMVLCSVLFSFQKDQQVEMYMDFYEQRLGLIAELQMSDLQSNTRLAMLALDSNEGKEAGSENSSNFRAIKYKLNSLMKEDMKGMYVISMKSHPDSTDAEPSLIMIQGNDTMEKAGYTAGTAFPVNHGKQEAIAKLNEVEAASTNGYTANGQELMTTFTRITNDQGQTIAYLGVDFDYSIIEKELSGLFWKSVRIGGSIELIFIILIAIYTRIRFKPLVNVHRVAEQAAQGDLTVRLQVKGQDEISKIAMVINQMIEHLNSLLHEIKHASHGVSQATYEIGRSAEETALSASEVSASMQQVASGAQLQLQSSEETKQAVQQIAVGIQHISESSTAIMDKTNDTKSKAADGRQVINQTVVQMEHIQSASEITYQSLSGLTQEVERIVEVIRFIQNVAKQTELLALNASIEAARAGEQGKGFQVVATEIRNLADSSKSSLSQIIEMIEQVYKYKQQTEAAVENQKQAVEHGLEIVGDADQAFMEISELIEAISEFVNAENVIAIEMSASSEEVTASLDELSVIANQSHASSERVAASTEEQSAMTEQLKASVDTLQSLSTVLEKQIAQFKLNDASKS